MFIQRPLRNFAAAGEEWVTASEAHVGRQVRAQAPFSAGTAPGSSLSGGGNRLGLDVYQGGSAPRSSADRTLLDFRTTWAQHRAAVMRTKDQAERPKIVLIAEDEVIIRQVLA